MALRGLVKGFDHRTREEPSTLRHTMRMVESGAPLAAIVPPYWLFRWRWNGACFACTSDRDGARGERCRGVLFEPRIWIGRVRRGKRESRCLSRPDVERIRGAIAARNVRR